MKQGLTVWRCRHCGTGYFPAPLVCSRCRRFDWKEDRVLEAVVEEITTVRHMLGQADWKPRRLGAVRTSDGQLITVGLLDDSGPGAVIDLFEDEKAPFGRARQAPAAR